MDASARIECLPDTRLDICGFITDWLQQPPGTQNILWLYGVAGCGKSTIANTIASAFRGERRLGAFLFFDRSAKSDPSNVIRTLAFQLGSFNQHIGDAIAAAISSNPGITESSLQLQFSKLLQEPLLQVAAVITSPIVVILDALDECGNPESRKILLRVFGHNLQRLSTSLRILITSRPQQDILHAFRRQQNVLPYELDISTKSNHEDIMSYLHQRFNELRETMPILPEPNWPGEEAIATLRKHSTGLFIWCSTAMLFIEKGYNKNEKLKVLLNVGPQMEAEAALDDLYTVALQNSGLWEDATFRRDFCSIFGAIILAKEALSDQTIDELLGSNISQPSIHMIQHFHCVLHHRKNGTVYILHPSFADFLMNQQRCCQLDVFIDPVIHNYQFVLQCFQGMKDNLHFNICGLETSSLLNNQILDLDVRIKSAIPRHLSYSCRFWANHLHAISGHSELIGKLTEHITTFLHKELLYWLEVLSLKGEVNIAPGCMFTIADLCKVSCMVDISGNLIDNSSGSWKGTCGICS